MDWDFRKKRPYSGYDQFEFDIPTARTATATTARVVRVEEMRQSLRIIEQCLNNMPAGPYKSDHPLATPPLKERTMHDIETLITHFLGVSWGPVIPPGEALRRIEATKGNNGYYLVSDGGTMSYRTRIRTPSFPHMQMVPLICRGLMIPDLLAILGSIDFVLGGRGPVKAAIRDSIMLTARREDRRSRRRLRTIRQKQAVCIDALKIVQRHRGLGLGREPCATSPSMLDMTPDELDSVATFYNLIFRKPVGRHVILICDSVSCWIMGYDQHARAPGGAAGHRPRRDHAGRPLHAAADRLPGRLRPCAGHDDRRRPVPAISTPAKIDAHPGRDYK